MTDGGSNAVDVFVSYKREDQRRVSLIVDGLRRAGLDTWWDADIPGGARWRSELHDRLASARCVVVVWSEQSAGPDGDFVRDEATRAMKRGVLLPVQIDRVDAPVGFGEVQSLDLIGWSGNIGDARFQDVLDDARAIVQGRPRVARRRLCRRRLTIAAAATGLTAALGFTANVVGLEHVLCRVPGIRSGCAAAGLGGLPTRAEEQVWASRVRGDCEALRAYLKRFPTGAYAAEADRRLSTATKTPRTWWTREAYKEPLEVPAGGPFATEDAAQNDAKARAPDEAEFACTGYKSTEFSRLKGVKAVPHKWNCSRTSGGVRCGFSGTAICDVETRHQETVSVCE
jgi:hypothetical protein